VTASPCTPAPRPPARRRGDALVDRVRPRRAVRSDLRRAHRRARQLDAAAALVAASTYYSPRNTEWSESRADSIGAAQAATRGWQTLNQGRLRGLIRDCRGVIGGCFCRSIRRDITAARDAHGAVDRRHSRRRTFGAQRTTFGARRATFRVRRRRLSAASWHSGRTKDYFRFAWTRILTRRMRIFIR
jgi:hypothetical protein